MAGSRYYKIGTIFSRTSGLIKSEALPFKERPLWYDVYEAFPPKVEPRFDREVPTNEIKSILYPEDKIRAEFYRRYGSVGISNMFERNSKPTICQLFIEEWNQLDKDSFFSDEEMWDQVESSLLSRGLKLTKQSSTNEEKIYQESPGTVKIKLSDLFHKESQKLDDS